MESQLDRILILDLLNPISLKEIDGAINKILNCTKCKMLLLDFGNHSFDSLTTLKFLRISLNKIQLHLLQFKRVAFVCPTKYVVETQKSNNLKFFTSKLNAKKWLQTDFEIKNNLEISSINLGV